MHSRSGSPDPPQRRHDLEGSVSASRRAAAALEQVCAMAMALPRREPGPLTYPSFRTLRPPA